MHAPPDADFLALGGGARGRRLCLHHAARGDMVRGAVVYVHPFADEMNKSRRMAAMQSRALARSGFAVLQIDLFGCGDSDGELEQATWDDWLQDIVDAACWLRERHAAPLTLWGLRAGCLLAAQAAARIDPPCDLLFWQPASAGKVVLQQFLRLKSIGDMLDGQAKGAMNRMREQLAAGGSVDVAGYRLCGALAEALENATLDPPAHPRSVVWLEVAPRDDTALSPASSRVIERWTRAGHAVAAAVVAGPSFWQTVETEDAPALLDATLASMTESTTA